MASDDPEREPDPLDVLRMRLDDIGKLGLSQRYISRSSGVPRATLFDFVNERVHAPSPGTLEKLYDFVRGI